MSLSHLSPSPCLFSCISLPLHTHTHTRSAKCRCISENSAESRGYYEWAALTTQARAEVGDSNTGYLQLKRELSQGHPLDKRSRFVVTLQRRSQGNNSFDHTFLSLISCLHLPLTASQPPEMIGQQIPMT